MTPFISLLISDYGIIGISLALGIVGYVKVTNEFKAVKKEMHLIELESLRSTLLHTAIREDIQEIKQDVGKIHDHLLNKQ